MDQANLRREGKRDYCDFKNLGIVEAKRGGKKGNLEDIIISKVTPLHRKVFTVLQVAIHNFENRLWKAHAKKREGYFGMSVYLA